MRCDCYLQNMLINLMLFSVILLTGCTRLSSAYYPPDPGRTDNQTVYIVNHGLHTGIVLPKKEAAPYMSAFDDFKHARYLEIGWGDETYYQTDPNTLWMGIRALFWPTNSVIHVAALQTDPVNYFSNKEVIQLKLSQTGFSRMVKVIYNSFALNQQGELIKLGKGLYGTSKFYRAKGSFHLFNNCNVWSAKAIRSSGFPINTFSVFTSDNIIYQLKQYEH